MDIRLIGDYMYLFINNERININVAYSWKQKTQGLMFKKNIREGLLIPNCISVHTYFMKDNIDILFLNEKLAIEYIYQNIPKNKIIAVNEVINKTSVLELPKNTSKSLRIGDVLTFEFENVI